MVRNEKPFSSSYCPPSYQVRRCQDMEVVNSQMKETHASGSIIHTNFNQLWRPYKPHGNRVKAYTNKKHYILCLFVVISFETLRKPSERKIGKFWRFYLVTMVRPPITLSNWDRNHCFHVTSHCKWYIIDLTIRGL